jgi:hypothetical protein|nr:MAG TPA: hypothetical protein [Caudoviricetes sp.]
MTSNGYYPNKLIYLGDNTENRKAILVSVPNEFTDAVLETIELGATAFEDKYRQVAAAAGAEFVDVNDIKIIGQDNRPTINNLRKSK